MTAEISNRLSPLVSVVICTRNRAEYLHDCLQYIAEQRPLQGWELVIVNNGSMDRTASVLAEFRARVTFPMTVVSECVPGLGNARNAGCAVARGEIIAF